jgi:hypothetical protein
MKNVIRRPQLSPGKGSDFLLQDHFQVAYVTTDLARACEVLGKRYGLKDYKFMEGEMPSGDGYLRVGIGWAGATMYELIQAEGKGGEFYTKRLPAEGFAIRHHHLGYFIETKAAWDALEARIAREGWSVPFRGEMPGFLNAVYIEAPELEHYLEYIYCEPAGVEFFESAPNN